MPSKVSRYGPAVFAWLLLIIVSAAFYYLVIPGIIEKFEIIGIFLTIGESLVLLSVLANFLMATVMDPGVLPKATASEEQQLDDFRAPLYKNVEVHGITVRMKWCVTCHFYRPPRCSHCSVCDNCIDSFDHHCPWLNNCIGRRNYRYFFIFLITLSVHIICVFTFCLMYTLRTKMDLLTKENVGSIVIMVTCGFVVLPVIGLTCFHVFLIATGRTTNEQVTGKFRSGYNPFNTGVCRNIAMVCCGPQFPRFSDYVGTQDMPDFYTAVSYKKGDGSLAMPLLAASSTSVPAGNHTGSAVGAQHVQVFMADGRVGLTGKKQPLDGHIVQYHQLMKRDAAANATGIVGSAPHTAIVNRSRSSNGGAGSDLDETNLLNISRDSSMVGVRVFPKSGSIGVPSLRGGEDDASIGGLDPQGSKCNLLDDNNSAFEAAGASYRRALLTPALGGGDSISAIVNYEDEQQRPDDTGKIPENRFSSPGNERYQQILREAYSGASVRHKPPVAVSQNQNCQPRSAAGRKNVPSQNGPVSTQGQQKGILRGGASGDGVPRFAYVPASSLAQSTVNKSQSMDALRHNHQVNNHPQAAPRFSVASGRTAAAPSPSSPTSSDYYNYKRPLSFTQAVQLHDSLTRLNSAGGSVVSSSSNNSTNLNQQNQHQQRPRAGTTSGGGGSHNVSEIRV